MPPKTGHPSDETPVELPIDGVLDLHTFQPRELRHLVPDYLAACRERHILRVRMIHGKGTGTLRRTVHSLLARDPAVESFALASAAFGGWGATIVHLKPLPAPASSAAATTSAAPAASAIDSRESPSGTDRNA